MRQVYDRYTAEDQDVWKILFERQQTRLQGVACAEYLACLEQLKPVLHANAIPNLDALSTILMETTGWSIHIVPGLIPVGEFLELLQQRKFCSSTWVRERQKLDYLEEPDMFHDIFGHIPLLMNPKYADFAQAFGELGVRFAKFPEIINQLQRLYWFTIEFGLIRSADQLEVFGAGIISSFGETNHVFAEPNGHLPFDLQAVLNHPFTNTEIQQRYYTLYQLDDLYALIPQLEAHFEQLVATSLTS